MRTRRALIAALTFGATALSSTLAQAHFRLITPGNWMMQSTDGSPQKMGPCGNEAPQMPSNATTPFKPGDTVTIQLEETVYHPGHYRVALAVNSPTELPPEPMVTAGATQCGSVAIQQNPTYPILADGMLVHSQPFSAAQSFQVKLPTNVTCASCTLQIIEFMSSHGAPCFYHHCAKISIQDGATDGGAGTPDAARDSAGGAGGAGGAAGSGATGGSAGSGASGGGAGTGGGTGGGSAGSGGSAGVGTGGATGGTGSGATGGIGGSGTSGGSAGSGGAGTTTGAGGSADGGGAGKGGSAGSGAEPTGCACSLARAHADWLVGPTTLLGLALATARRRRRRP
ncbi:MAG TPA: SCE4755 family polysaccharide monooxygenase-like protein [Polyangiaceae bacterium]|nr:SCE4755 family polysaccharide monooxygenase-like protein [Polyangiaceae bacterium]